MEHGKALQYCVLTVDKEGVWLSKPNNIQGYVPLVSAKEIESGKPLKHHGVPNAENKGVTTSQVSNGANIFCQLCDFFTTTVVEQAKAIWRAFVSAITSLAKWVMESVTELWNSAVEAVKNISSAVANFLKKFWYNEGEFVARLHRASEKVKNNVADAVMKVADKMNSIAWGRMEKVLKAQGYAVESMSKEEMKTCWKSYMKGNGLTPEEEADADAILNGDGEKGGGRLCD